MPAEYRVIGMCDLKRNVNLPLIQPVSVARNNTCLSGTSQSECDKEGECDSDLYACDSDTPRVSGTGERREAERGARASLFVCVGSFSVLLNTNVK